VGREAGRPVTGAGQKLAALGFLLAGIGLFVIPHDAGLGQLVAEASDPAHPDHARALVGLVLIVAGIVAGVAGTLMGRREPA
jgi:uncharacterized protein YjeT (DUF2065 family)